MDASRGTAPQTARPPRRRTGAVVLAFLLGLLTAAVAGTALLWTGALDDVPGMAAPTASPSSEPTTEPETVASGDVPASCVRSAEYNQVVNAALDEIAVGIRDQDARTLEEALGAIQDAQPGSEEDSADCLAAAGQSSTDDGDDEEPEDEPTEEPTESAEPSQTPSAEPSATPTP